MTTGVLTGRALRIAGITAASAWILCSCAGPSVTGGSPTVITTSPAAAQLFADDIKPVCQGATVSRATPYAAAGGSHKAILFSPNDGSPYENTSTLPEDWMVESDANSDAYPEATTGKLLSTTELDGTDDTCPSFMSFDDENQSKNYDAPPSTDDLIAFVKPFVQP